ncbi:MAG: ABC transporter ATP-binding protein [Firmicutes bacterium]|nr:ABC transporter ATP-binding protein [Bacillota bacterium]
MQTKVVLKKLTKAYGRRRLFADISVTIPGRSVFVLHGPNGAGKTTLLRIICGLVPATSGEVEITVDGKLLAREESREHIGLVSPELELYGELSAVENLEFFAGVRGLPFSPAKARDLLTFVGLAGRGRDLVGTYSSGMKQRLKYAYALLHEPQILVLDEPTSNLDETGVAVVAEIIRRQKDRGIVIMATNEPGEVSYGDQTLALGQPGTGHLVQGPAH